MYSLIALSCLIWFWTCFYLAPAMFSSNEYCSLRVYMYCDKTHFSLFQSCYFIVFIGYVMGLELTKTMNFGFPFACRHHSPICRLFGWSPPELISYFVILSSLIFSAKFVTWRFTSFAEKWHKYTEQEQELCCQTSPLPALSLTLWAPWEPPFLKVLWWEVFQKHCQT